MKLSEIVPIATVLLTFVVICLEAAPQRKWQPKDSNPSDTRSAEEWKRTHGMSGPDFAKLKQELKKCKKLLTRTLDITVSDADIDDSEFLGDIILTPKQIAECIKNLNKTGTSGKGRHKRKSMPFNDPVYSVYRWGRTIDYLLDETYDANEINVIRLAIQHWEKETCIRFNELQPGDDLTQPYLFITKEDTGCWSFIGKTGNVPQQLNLAAGCVTLVGIPVHEIGHAIGSWHEQARTDRDQYVTINFKNIIKGKESNFAIHTNSDNYGIPYDYGSIMHYGGYSFVKRTTSPSIKTDDELFQQTIGQRIGLSDFDSKLYNKVHCNDICSTSLPCLRGGYPNPNDCNNCKCPDGFGGQYCDQVQQSDPTCNPYVSSPIQVENAEQCVESPGYLSGGYSHRSSCNWLLQAPEGSSIDGYFDGTFTLPCGWNSGCHQWVEIKYTVGLQLPGPRFCCTERPTATFRSQGSEMAVAFRSDTLSNEEGQTGFRFCFKLASTVEPTTTTTPAPSKGKGGKKPKGNGKKG